VYSKRKKKRRTAEIEITFSRLEIVLFHLLNKSPSVTPAAKIHVFARVIKNLSTKGTAANNEYPAAIKTKDPRQ
jgi:hypothetical protein